MLFAVAAHFTDALIASLAYTILDLDRRRPKLPTLDPGVVPGSDSIACARFLLLSKVTDNLGKVFTPMSRAGIMIMKIRLRLIRMSRYRQF